MLARLLDAGLRAPPTLRWALLGGGPIAPALLERAARAGVPVAPTYGMTEACSQIATFGLAAARRGAWSTADDGEMLVRGPIVAPGALSADGWLHTGDLGRFDDRGGSRSSAASPTRSSAAARTSRRPRSRRCCSSIRPWPTPRCSRVADPEWGEAVVATVVLRDGREAAPDALRAHCASRLAAFKVPKAIAVRGRAAAHRIRQAAAARALIGTWHPLASSPSRTLHLPMS